MLKRSFICLSAAALLLLAANGASGETDIRLGVRGGVGTDVNLGLAYGAGANFVIELPANYVELGILFFGGSFEESSEEGGNTYDETTDLLVFGFLANYMINYSPDDPGMYFVTGLGFGSINVEWEEKSETDSSLGTPLPPNGSMQSEEGSAGGSIFNIGVGRNFASGLDVRVEVPVILVFSPPGEATSVVPTAIATVGFRF
jgi:hypothetical protein